jgi:polyisoprenoid-binding protein YceI
MEDQGMVKAHRLTLFLFALIFSLLVLPRAARAEVETYAIASDHSFANWTIRHVAARVSGTFSDVTGKVTIDRQNLANSRVDATINVLSLNSSHRERDSHLLTSEFFDALKFKTMRFVSTAVKPTAPDRGILVGDLTIHGVTRPVELSFRVLGFGPDPWGGYRSGFEATTVLKRSDFGITWGLDMPGGGPVGDEVEITLLIEGVKLGPDGNPVKLK